MQLITESHRGVSAYLSWLSRESTISHFLRWPPTRSRRDCSAEMHHMSRPPMQLGTCLTSGKRQPETSPIMSQLFTAQRCLRLFPSWLLANVIKSHSTIAFTPIGQVTRCELAPATTHHCAQCISSMTG